MMVNGGGTGPMWIFGLRWFVGVVVLGQAFSGPSAHINGCDSGRGTGSGGGRGPTILEERRTRGELSTDAYRERLRALKEDGR
ncbi:SHOCT domain-containing protein [Kocuria kalidii]|uniref:SHOCT domain-containing protein n=1 Tax=Kocuria kalidii TaxID=3376283 RepID=UPI003795C1F0